MWLFRDRCRYPLYFYLRLIVTLVFFREKHFTAIFASAFALLVAEKHRVDNTGNFERDLFANCGKGMVTKEKITATKKDLQTLCFWTDSLVLSKKILIIWF